MKHSDSRLQFRRPVGERREEREGQVHLRRLRRRLRGHLREQREARRRLPRQGRRREEERALEARKARLIHRRRVKNVSFSDFRNHVPSRFEIVVHEMQ